MSKVKESGGRFNRTPEVDESRGVKAVERLGEKQWRWDQKKAGTQAVAEAIEFLDKKLSDSLNYCAWTMRGELVSSPMAPDRFVVKQVMFCKKRICHVCQWRRTNVATFNALKLIEKAMDNVPKGDQWRCLLLTLTVKNPDLLDLRETIKQMNQAFKRMVDSKFFEPFKGYIKATEVTRSADGTAHPHFHVVLIVDQRYREGRSSFRTHRDFCNAWQKEMGLDYTPVVDIRTIKGDKKHNSMQKAALEVVKYTTKLNDLVQHPEWMLEMQRQMRGLRVLSSGGVLKGSLINTATLKDMLSEKGDGIEPSEDGSLTREQVIACWRQYSKQYLLLSVEEYQEEREEKAANPFRTGNVQFGKPFKSR